MWSCYHRRSRHQSHWLHQAGRVSCTAGSDACRMRELPARVGGPILCLVDKMADFTSLLCESINLIPHPLGYALTFKTRFWLATRGNDEEELKGWDECGTSVKLGMYRHDEEIEIAHGAGRSTMRMRFRRFPLLSPKLPTSSKTSFSVTILDFQLVWWCVRVSFALICAWCSLSQNMRLCSKESLVANLSPCLFNGKDWRGHPWLRTTWSKSSSTAPAGSATAGYSSEDMNVTECFQGDFHS